MAVFILLNTLLLDLKPRQLEVIKHAKARNLSSQVQARPQLSLQRLHT